MPTATDLTEAIGYSLQNLNLRSDASELQSCIANFNEAWIVEFDPNTAAARTVLDWIVLLRSQEATLPATGTLGQISDAGDVLTRMLFAVIGARDATPARITSAQATAVLDAYNAYIAIPGG